MGINKWGSNRIFGQNIEAAVKEALELRKKLRSIPIRDIHDTTQATDGASC